MSRTLRPGKLADTLAYPPRAMRLETAAAYLSISTSSFLRLVDEGALPQATKKHSMALWDRLDLDAAFEDWKTPAGPNENTVHKLLRERQQRDDRETKLKNSHNKSHNALPASTK